MEENYNYNRKLKAKADGSLSIKTNAYQATENKTNYIHTLSYATCMYLYVLYHILCNVPPRKTSQNLRRRSSKL